ncbi:unnamed protein product [Heligmosomoides polygyrus]|uniref:HTH psq-type domain-containing protein n=1 Tax=Heligmosomoides polygyrus TaxID=6339 RepID=A0A183FQJ9_HELPZ|nr:unnamed protein product [Heligmosomoides polygyrus]
MEDRPRSGRLKTASISEVVKRIREKVRRNSRRSMRELARDEEISECTVRRSVKKARNASLQSSEGAALDGFYGDSEAIKMENALETLWRGIPATESFR